MSSCVRGTLSLERVLVPLRLLIRSSRVILAESCSSHPPLITFYLLAGCADLHLCVFIIPADESASCPLSSVFLAIFPGASLFANRSSLHF